MRAQVKLAAIAALLVAIGACGSRRDERAARPAAQIPPGSAVQLVEALRQGGYVLLVRHAQAEPGADPARLVLEDCATQRGLSPYGREQAAAIGAALPRLGVPIGEVRASPYCRCADTARLAFGHMLLDDDLLPLRDGGGERRLAAVRRLLGTPPLPGRNSALVGHSDTIARLAGSEIAEGEMLVIRPAPGGGSFVLLGRLTAEQLASLAHAALARAAAR